MRTRSTLRPGERGTRKLLAKYGERLVCVRYRHDEGAGRRIKTAELIVEETEEEAVDQPISPYERRFISVGLAEIEIREKIKAAGGRWHPEAVAWSLPYAQIVSLGLTARMMEGAVAPGLSAQRRFANIATL